MIGYIKLYRQIFDSPFYFKVRFDEIRAWIDLLLLANYEDRVIKVGRVDIEVRRGQVSKSIRYLADRWQWSTHTVQKFLKRLEKMQQVATLSVKPISLITIVNYEKFQGMEEECATPFATPSATPSATPVKEKVSPTPPLKESRQEGKEGEEDKETPSYKGGKKKNSSSEPRKYIDKRPSKSEDVKVRRQWLLESIRDGGKRFPKDMCNEFYLYWSELTPEGDSMRFELEKTWETVRRLATWYCKDKKKWNK